MVVSTSCQSVQSGNRVLVTREYSSVPFIYINWWPSMNKTPTSKADAANYVAGWMRQSRMISVLITWSRICYVLLQNGDLVSVRFSHVPLMPSIMKGIFVVAVFNGRQDESFTLEDGWSKISKRLFALVTALISRSAWNQEVPRSMA